MQLPASAKVGLLFVLGFLITAIAGPWVAPYSPTQKDLDAILLGVSQAHWLGTDANGVDLFSAMLHGARIALIISGSVVLISSFLGTFLGVVAGYFGGWVDEIIMRIVDVLLSFPGILLNITIVALIAQPGVGVLIFALAVNGWVRYARLARGQVLSLREREFVQAARCIGAGHKRIMLRYITPNLMSLIFVQMSFAVGGVMAVEASLSFLGLGPQVDYTWGALLEQGQTYLWVTPRIAIFPGLAIMLVVLGSNLLGDGLRDSLDPKRKKMMESN